MSGGEEGAVVPFRGHASPPSRQGVIGICALSSGKNPNRVATKAGVTPPLTHGLYSFSRNGWGGLIQSNLEYQA